MVLVGTHKDELDSEGTQLREARELIAEHLEGMYIKRMGIIEQICQPPKQNHKLQWFFAVDSTSRENIVGKGLQCGDPVMGQIRSALQEAVKNDNRKVTGLWPQKERAASMPCPHAYTHTHDFAWTSSRVSL